MTTTRTTTTRFGDADLPTSGPWWRHPMMWLVVGGPTVVVAASVATLALAITHPDPVVRSTSAVDRSGVAADEIDDATKTPGRTPAMNARNHAATGGQAR
nr:hypothetical protein [uncultured Roseateles sp.]